MTVKLKDILGLLIDKKDPEGKDFCTVGYTAPFNDAISLQGSRSITLDREETAKFLCENVLLWNKFENLSDVGKEFCYTSADCLNNNFHKLLKVGK